MKRLFRYIARPAFSRPGPCESFASPAPALSFAQREANRTGRPFVVYVRRSEGRSILLLERINPGPRYA